ncbi:MAG: hypothetical protein H0T11_03535, partial [Chthoniobacterales bacterium]|nr:hypothetical protein [Chthoniobacterales bacterium]
MKLIAVTLLASSMALTQIALAQDDSGSGRGAQRNVERPRAAARPAPAQGVRVAPAPRVQRPITNMRSPTSFHTPRFQRSPQRFNPEITRSPRLGTPTRVAPTTPQATQPLSASSDAAASRRNRPGDVTRGGRTGARNGSREGRRGPGVGVNTGGMGAANAGNDNPTDDGQAHRRPRGRDRDGNRWNWHHHNWDRNHHHRDWWHRHYTRFVIFGGGYYYWNSGFWYPAYGYDPYFSTYTYDAPIYAYDDLSPEQVMANVQAELSRRGYYNGPIDGTYGPQ